MFDGLSVRDLDLFNNQLTMLPVGVFDGLSVGRSLDLSSNQLETLPENVFEGLRVHDLYLNNNQLKTLLAGVFEGLRVDGDLDLRGNPGAPFSLTVELERVDAAPSTASPATVGLRLVEGTPSAIMVPLTVSGGTLSSISANFVSFVAGATISDTFMAMGSSTTTVGLGPLPALPSGYRGLQLARGEPLVLPFATTVSMAAATYPVTEGAVVMIAVEVSPIAASDLTLHYTIDPDTDDTTADAEATDYADANSGNIMIPANTGTVDIEIRATDDNLAEPAEVFVVTLSDGTAADGSTVVLGAEIMSTVTISASSSIDVDFTGEGVITIADAKVFYYALLQELDDNDDARIAALASIVPGANDRRNALMAVRTLVRDNPEALDFNARDDVDPDVDMGVDIRDAVLFYYAQALPGSLGDGTAGSGFRVIREALLGPLVPPGYSDQDLRDILRKINNLVAPP